MHHKIMTGLFLGKKNATPRGISFSTWRGYLAIPPYGGLKQGDVWKEDDISWESHRLNG